MSNDAELIKALGGVSKVAELLGYDKDSGGIQRVQNWLTRGIPPKVKLERPDLFLRKADTPAAVERRENHAFADRWARQTAILDRRADKPRA